MTVTLHLKPEVEAGLQAQAQASGMLLEDYLLSVVEGVAQPKGDPQASAVREDRAESVRRVLEFGDRHRLSLGEPVTRALMHEGHRIAPPLSDYGASRNAMCDGQDHREVEA